MRPISKARYIVLILLVIVLVGLGLYLSRLIPSIEQQLNADSLRLIVRITTPLNGSHWQVGMPIPVSANVIGNQPIQSMELWVDGNLAQTINVSHNSNDLSWTIQSQGDHILIVRAMDSHGQVANSNVVHVIGTEQDSANPYTLYKTKPGDTVTKLAASFGTTPQDILKKNPNLGNGSSIPPGTGLKIPVNFPPSSPPQPPAPNGGSPSPFKNRFRSPQTQYFSGSPS